MKKNLLKYAFVLTSVFALTGCSYIIDIITGGSRGGYSYPSSQSSYVPATSIPEEDVEKEFKAPTVTYMDVVKNSVYNISSTPCIGTPKLLVIPVWFKDSTTFISASKKDSVREDIQTAYFGTNENTGWRSVKSYYYEESHGQLTLSGTVSEWYEVNANVSNYSVDDDTTSKTCGLAQAATDWYFNNHTDNRRNYDYDGDGFLDGVMLIYAAPDYTSWNKDNYTNLWAYCFWAGQSSYPSATNPVLNAFFWASYDFMYGNNAQSKTGKSNYAGGDTRYCAIDAHTYIHEMGHMFGLEDYYDYSENGYDPAGSFSMQDHNVGGHDPFSAYALGWAKAYVPNQAITINLKPFTSSGEVVLLTPSFNEYNSPFDEYILIEYYTPTGLNQFDTTHKYMSRYPSGANEPGIRLWHVDARLAYTSDDSFHANQITTNPNVGSNAGVALAMSNTYDDGEDATEYYLSVLGKNYYNYNVLQMIRNSTTANYSTLQPELSNGTLFKTGSFFSMDSFGRQFANRGKLNTNKQLGFTFNVNGLTSEGASITINKI